LKQTDGIYTWPVNPQSFWQNGGDPPGLRVVQGGDEPRGCGLDPVATVELLPRIEKRREGEKLRLRAAYSSGREIGIREEIERGQGPLE
jgi:hypothetical protein